MAQRSRQAYKWEKSKPLLLSFTDLCNRLQFHWNMIYTKLGICTISTCLEFTRSGRCNNQPLGRHFVVTGQRLGGSPNLKNIGMNICGYCPKDCNSLKVTTLYEKYSSYKEQNAWTIGAGNFGEVHTWYLSRAPRAYPCNFFLAGVIFFGRCNFFTDLTRKIGNLLCILP